MKKGIGVVVYYVYQTLKHSHKTNGTKPRYTPLSPTFNSD